MEAEQQLSPNLAALLYIIFPVFLVCWGLIMTWLAGIGEPKDD